MRFNFLLLLAAYNFATTIATPVPSDFDDIERRWSEGQSEVCALIPQSSLGCYIFAWAMSVARRVRQSHCKSPPADLPQHLSRKTTLVREIDADNSL